MEHNERGMEHNERDITIDYVNWRGLGNNNRRILPMSLWFGSTPWHQEPQWLLTAWDYGKQAYRDFALKDLRQTSSPPTAGRKLFGRWGVCGVAVFLVLLALFSSRRWGFVSALTGTAE